MASTVLRGRLNYKRVASYFKRCGLTVQVERTSDGEYLLPDRLVLVKCLPDHEISLYTNFPDEWGVARFEAGKGPAVQAGVSTMAQFWANAMANEWHAMTLTRELRETPNETKGKPGTLWRKFTREDHAAYFNKSMLDLISPDLDELEEFLFEQTAFPNGPMRVAGVYGPIALVMPAQFRER